MDFTRLTDLAAMKIRNALGKGGVTYTPANGSPVPLRPVFDRSYIELSPDGMVPVQSTNPRILIRLADLAQPPGQGDTVLIDSITYNVVTVEPDGHGMAVLKLEVKG